MARYLPLCEGVFSRGNPWSAVRTAVKIPTDTCPKTSVQLALRTHLFPIGLSVRMPGRGSGVIATGIYGPLEEV